MYKRVMMWAILMLLAVGLSGCLDMPCVPCI